jgi:CheY-like chemotaxis protein
VLVAEDSKTNQAVMRAMLSRLGYSFDVVANGVEAVAAVRRVSYDLVLMDLFMPLMNGIEATVAIRAQNDAFGRVPIVGLTADISEVAAARFSAAGAHAMLKKPLTLDALENCIGGMQPHMDKSDPQDQPPYRISYRIAGPQGPHSRASASMLQSLSG